MTDAKVVRTGPLVGVKVLELAHVMAGPVCGLMLADMGADVIKIEKIAGGDDTRRQLPPDINGESAAYMMMNRNKRGLALDLKSADGKAILKRMVRDADILIENYRSDTMPSLGLGYDELKTINPGLIYAAITGFGRTGPMAQAGGFDLVAQGMSGLMSITGEGPGRPPVKVGAPICDITAGLLLSMGVLAAYTHRLKTGQGQFVDTSLLEAGITHTYWQSAICFATGEPPGPLGSAHPLNTPYQAFETADGWINIGAANQTNWERLLGVLDAEDLATDERFKTGKGRMANITEFIERLSVHFKRRTTAEWLAALEKAGLPSGPVLNVQEMHAHPQTLAREMVPYVDHPVAGRMQTIGLPVKFSETPGGVKHAAPLLGQHSRDVLAEFGYTAQEIEGFVAAGAIKPSPRH